DLFLCFLWLFLSPAAAHRSQEFGVALVLAHLIQQKLHSFHSRQGIQNLSQYPDPVQFILGNKQFFLTGSRPVDIDGWKDALIDEFAVETDLHVTGALELLEYHVIHAASRVD